MSQHNFFLITEVHIFRVRDDGGKIANCECLLNLLRSPTNEIWNLPRFRDSTAKGCDHFGRRCCCCCYGWSGVEGRASASAPKTQESCPRVA